MQRLGCDAHGRVEVVDVAARFEHPRDLHGIVDADTAVGAVVTRQSHPHDAVAPDGVPHGGHDLEQQTGPPGEVPAVAVGATVRRGCEKSAQDGRLGALDLDTVEAALGAAAGDVGVAATSSVMSDSVIARGTSRKSGSGSGLGAHNGCPVYIEVPCAPLWLSCARIRVPYRCTASVRRR